RHARLLRWGTAAVIAAILAVLVQRELIFQQHRRDLVNETVEVANRVQAESTDNKVIGGAILMGLVEDSIKKLLAGTLEEDAREIHVDFAAILDQYGAENVFVLSGDGTTVAYLNKEGKASGLGKNLRFRPYCRRALAGVANVYPAIGGTSHERGLYFAAPVYSGNTRDTPISGVYTIKMAVADIDRLLQGSPHPVLLVSPDGMVFATNRNEFLFKLAAPIDANRRAELATDKQFGTLFDSGPPLLLPFAVDGRDVRFEGRSHAVSSTPINWLDDAGAWRIVVLQDKSEWLPLWRELVLAAGVLLAFWLCALVVLGRQRTLEATRLLRFENERRMRQITNNLPVAVYQFTLDAGKRPSFQFMSPAVTAITGLQASDVLASGATLFSRIDPDGKGGLLEHIGEAARHHRNVHERLSFGGGESEARWIEWHCALAHQPDGEEVWNGYLADVTAEHTAGQALQLAKLAAEDATRSKSLFLANMSHEIRTPMNAIIGMSHLALKTALTARQQDYIQKIERAGKHLLGIINDILDFSKIEADKLSVEQTPFELDQVLENVATVIADKVNAKGLELVFDIGAEVPGSLLGDPLRLGQILINYANNAVKFTEAGEVRMTVRVKESGETGVLLHFAVHDTGIGLSPQQMAQLFQSFQQADASTTRKYGGTGLGLAISKKLAELMGGSVGVESELGKGSTFWFTARLGLGHATRAKLLPQPDLRGRRVLVVDDNDSARSVLALTLAAMSFEVATAESGEAALACVRSAAQPFNVILLDWQMPGMSGIDTAHALRAALGTALPHLAMVTAFGREEVLAQARAADIEDVLIKPVNASVLFNTLIRLLGGTSDDEARYSAAPQADALATIAGARVLLAEDNALNQQVASELLQDAGLVVEIANNGREAVAMALAQPYDIILMDMQMPEMDGVEATRLLRAEARLSGLPIVAMTANAMQSDRDLCIEAGMIDFVTKPIEPEQLFGALLRAIAPRHVPLLRPQAAAPIEDDGGLPAAIDGLDMAAGLRRVLGKRARYLAMLRGFVDNQAASAAQVRAALAAGDHATAVRLAHTLKGLAGNIGADALQQAADALERALGHGEPADALLAKLEQALASQLAALRAALPAAAPALPAASVDAAQCEAVCRQLARLLADDDAKAEKVLLEHQAMLAAALPQHFRALQQAIGQFDFEAALAILDEALPAHINEDAP
ncbi:MAG: response regulator, partial [Pseudomonadota bacterium]